MEIKDLCKNIKFFPNVVIGEENPQNTQEVMNLIGEYGLSYNPESLDCRVFTIDSAELKKTLESYKNAGLLQYFENDISKLRFSSEKVIKRVEACKKAGKGFSNEAGLCSFVFNSNEWTAVINGLDQTVEAASIETVFGNKASDISNAINVEGELDINGFDRYWRLTQLMSRCMEMKFGISEIGDSEKYIRNLIANLNNEITDNDILIAAFINSTCIKVEELGEIKKIIGDVIEAELSESNGVAL